MSAIKETAEKFYDDCETGKGWEVCRQYCHDGATFSAQTDALASVDSVEGYTEWTKGLLTPLPDGHYELKALAVDEGRETAVIFAVFHGTHTGEGGPLPPTGKKVAAEYVYALKFDGGKIRHMTKVWHDGISLRQLGWA